jgi:hypothetical protein
MATDTDQLIARLSADARPVQRLRHPIVRAGLWLIGVAIGGALLAARSSHLDAFMERAHDPRQIIELIATLATGILAIVAAFEMSLPDRSRAWALLPMPALALWLATTGLGCLRAWIAGEAADMAESMDCFIIIVGTSIPLGLALTWMLRRAKPLAPAPVAAIGGLGVAAIGAFLLQFFHPFDVTAIDLAFHAAAITIVVGVATWSSRRALA